MLGIIFTGGECPPAGVIAKALEGKEPLVIAADSGLAAAEQAGLRPRWIVGDMDSLDDVSRLAAYPPECVMRYEHEKDYTDTELAFSLAVEKGCDEIWISGGGGGRVDHLFAIRSLFERDVFPRRWITDGADIHCIDANGSGAFSINSLFQNGEKGAVVSVFPLGGGPWTAESAGLKWPLEGLSWDRGFFGLSNVAVNGDFSITAEAGRFMVILPLGAIE